MFVCGGCRGALESSFELGWVPAVRGVRVIEGECWLAGRLRPVGRVSVMGVV
jgi:hypothetical protein